MKGKWVHRIALALIPVGLLTTMSLAFSVINRPQLETADTPIVAQQPATPPPAAPAPAPATAPTTTETTTQPAAPAAPTQPSTEQQAPQQQPEELAEEPLPELVVDKTALTEAMADLERALDQAKLAVTALDADGQARYIHESINILAGYSDPAFRAPTGSTVSDTYKGVRPLLVEARVKREAAEVQWIAAVQQQLEARAKRLAELAQASGDVQLQPVQPPINLSASVGPTGVLGTRGVRVEEQATELVSRAIRQAAEALSMMPKQRSTSVNSENDSTSHASEQATSVMESVVRQLETAKKIVQIAIDR
jgi:hypothetical protein